MLSKIDLFWLLYVKSLFFNENVDFIHRWSDYVRFAQKNKLFEDFYDKDKEWSISIQIRINPMSMVSLEQHVARFDFLGSSWHLTTQTRFNMHKRLEITQKQLHATIVLSKYVTCAFDEDIFAYNDDSL